MDEDKESRLAGLREDILVLFDSLPYEEQLIAHQFIKDSLAEPQKGDDSLLPQAAFRRQHEKATH